ncbi:hypothetical protein VTL71DRAFT_7193 [Oculimacula yallundae]|uniref:Uncharacterized protein n=1 Tax=Oculimacula yallundae TaxID=86028 RepID=A0ABR4BW16_9HELO
MSFRIPRKPVRSGSGTSSEWSAQFKGRPGSLSAQELLTALQLPQAPPPARLRAMTEPPAYERVKSALHERYELEQQLRDIEEVIEERKSVYFNSRPNSRLASRPASIYSDSQEPMPAPIPLAPFNPTPQTPPSFAERVSSPLGQRPKTAPSKTVHIPSRLVPFTEASATFRSPSMSSTSSRPDRGSPAPPLPLVLQAAHPPLRKKKSFSRVSNWLFPASGEHSRNISSDSITNTPKPITSRDGFYQCVDLRPAVPLARSNSLSTVSTLESELDEPTIPTSWSPNSSPGTSHQKQQEVTIRELSMDSDRNEKSIELTRMRTFGEKTMGHDETWRMEPMPGHVPGRNSVGVAF